MRILPELPVEPGWRGHRLQRGGPVPRLEGTQPRGLPQLEPGQPNPVVTHGGPGGGGTETGWRLPPGRL